MPLGNFTVRFALLEAVPARGSVVHAPGASPSIPAAVLSDDPRVTQSRLNSRRFSNRLSMSLPFSWCLRGQNYDPRYARRCARIGANRDRNRRRESRTSLPPTSAPRLVSSASFSMACRRSDKSAARRSTGGTLKRRPETARPVPRPTPQGRHKTVKDTGTVRGANLSCRKSIRMKERRGACQTQRVRVLCR
jgi:hypothetical protein